MYSLAELYDFRLLVLLCQIFLYTNMKAFLVHVAVINTMGHLAAWYSKTADMELDKLIKNMVLMIKNFIFSIRAISVCTPTGLSTWCPEATLYFCIRV